MKKIYFFILAFVMAFSMCGCARTEVPLESYTELPETETMMETEPPTASEAIIPSEAESETESDAAQKDLSEIARRVAAMKPLYDDFGIEVWDVTDDQDLYYTETGLTKYGISISIMFYADTYFATYFHIPYTDEETALEQCAMMLRTYLCRDMTRKEQECLAEELHTLLLNPYDGVYLNDVDGITPVYLHWSEDMIHMRCA